MKYNLYGVDSANKVCYGENVGIIQRKDKELVMYQKLFNDTLSKLRLVLVATGNQDLMKAVAKIMFDVSDRLRENKILDKEHTQCNTKQTQK